jgi:organic radical activating enzyme
MEEFIPLFKEKVFSRNCTYFCKNRRCDVGCHWCDVKESWNASTSSVNIKSDCIHEKYSETVVGGAIDVGCDAIDPDA